MRQCTMPEGHREPGSDQHLLPSPGQPGLHRTYPTGHARPPFQCELIVGPAGFTKDIQGCYDRRPGECRNERKRLWDSGGVRGDGFPGADTVFILIVIVVWLACVLTSQAKEGTVNGGQRT